MLVARDTQGKFVNSLEEEYLVGEFFCPFCEGAVRVKRGSILRPHFAHISLRTCEGYTENESEEHLNLKASLYRWGVKMHSMQVEAFVPSIQQMADLLMDDKIALEVQCSSLSLKRLKERTENYRKIGCQVLWLLGKKLWLKRSLTALQKNFLYFSQNMGFYLWELDQEKEVLRLNYLIHEDLHGNVQYKTKEFPFERGDLLAVFRLPYQAQEVTSFLAKEDLDICRYVREQLYYQQPKWMQLQAEYYQKGQNLLTMSREDFYPQVRPVRAESFVQISQSLESYYSNFQQYYQQESRKNLQILYPPAFYQMILAENMIK
ncbi:competence protein CoiA [Streptococcus himalayensis]|uniref:Competence protein CoiA n=1 Tax=Streptococcus himalayensis TaxID=1888195 RepID=A0A917A3Z4_9STRE|nr:competence protein CoiA family protein [Streptococcus himalayensis]GGE25740.1 competence protein CoiA [Streptococcus himalayensis]